MGPKKMVETPPIRRFAFAATTWVIWVPGVYIYMICISSNLGKLSGTCAQLMKSSFFFDFLRQGNNECQANDRFAVHPDIV